ncbi:metal transporter CNNM4-like [Biomphalaria glabrata]|uniref:Metal transporter CNNM4-like n=1 Tax=Biomphalaria glabrata TaxID=6526 RepID=A0A9U8DW82_BIOGL|nr:metal transporter CNNM4-like [Biomphalaria glabrata]
MATDGIFNIYLVSFSVFIVTFLFKTCHSQRILGVYSISHNELGGIVTLHPNSENEIRLIGLDLVNTTVMFLTQDKTNCNSGRASNITHVNYISKYSASVTFSLKTIYGDKTLFMCVKNFSTNDYTHQGADEWLSFLVSEDKDEHSHLYLPLWLQITVCCVLILLSGLFSGLNLGLMSLDQTELKIIGKVGSEQEKNWAKRIGPLRKRGNFLLCTLLLGNVIVNSSFTILFENMTSGLTAVVISTIGIVIFGEIVPQAICSRHGLAVGANTYWLTVFFMILTFPASFPISLILDKILGEEMGQVYNKEKLQELIRMTADSRVLHDNEANIISGALQLTNKSVEDIMTKVEDVYMLEINRILDFETMTEIMHHGYTRVPVYDGEKINIVNLLNTKDLALIDPDDKTPLSTVCKFYDHKPLYVDHDVKLDAMLQEFLQGDSHMAIVQKLHNNEDHDPYYETMGVVTLEDVIEEILQREIIDEKDLITDNRQKAPRPRKRLDYEILGAEGQRSKLPKQLAFVAFQFLTTTVEPFSDAYLARNVLMNLMKKDIVVNLTPTEPVSAKNYIFQKGTPTDKFVLILQGTVEVIAGEENMVFESGPFSYFGKDAINLVRKQSSLNDIKAKEYIPDFSVRAVTDVQYLCINRALYLAALRTTKMLRNTGNIAVNEAFDAEFEKVTRLNSNRNSGFSSLLPFISNSPLESLKSDDVSNKKFTSSLDRLTFFHHKVDSLEALYRAARPASDSKEDCVEYHGEVSSLGQRHFPAVRSSRSSGDTNSKAINASPSPESRKRYLHSSLPVNNTHKVILHREPTDKNDEVTGGDASFTSNDDISLHNASLEEQNLASMDRSSESSVPEKVPLIAIKPGAAEGDSIKSSAVQITYNKDGERVPLINQTKSTNDLPV